MRTLLLVYIHGFKGDDDTFGVFPEHLCQVLQRSFPKVKVASIVYPKYDTRGDLPACVSQFRNWLQEHVIDLEVEKGTPSPMIDPSVKVVLIAHSMGGIVAADTLLSMLDDEAVSKKSEFMDSHAGSTPSSDPRIASKQPAKPKTPPTDPFIFPSLAGILAFDTPYLGLAPSMFANSADSNFRTASDVFSQVSAVGTALGLFGAAKASTEPAKSKSGAPAAGLPAPAAKSEESGWQWSKIAMYAGAASTVAAAGTAAYMNRNELTQGVTWVSSHLEFVGVLMKLNDLKARTTRASTVPHVGIANFYTVLGKGAQPATTAGGRILSVGGDGLRTFCSLPPALKEDKAGGSTANTDKRNTTDINLEGSDMRTWWYPALNDAAKDEVNAHVGMFHSKTNTGYKEMVQGAMKKIAEWAGTWCDANVA